MKIKTLLQRPFRLALSPSWAWLVVFAPALSYLVHTRLRSYTAWAGNVGQPLEGSRLVVVPLEFPGAGKASHGDSFSSCRELAKAFYLPFDPAPGSSCPKEFSLEAFVVIQSHLHSVTDSLWRHDSGLGRGYLLLSDAYANGRVWRWEVGGGPIAIGKTLQLEQSGCRSNRHHSCQNESVGSDGAAANGIGGPRLLGSGGMTTDFLGKDHFNEGQLVVAEWGEGRIVRLEENGARTPLVITVPNLCQEVDRGDDGNLTSSTHPSLVRLQQPTRLIYTPKGDLLFVDHHTDCNRSGLFLLRGATNIEPLQSLSESRAAHSWTSLSRISTTPELVPLTNVMDVNGESLRDDVQRIDGMAIASEPSGTVALYLVARLEKSARVMLLCCAKYEDEAGDEEEEEKDGSAASTDSGKRTQTAVVVDLTPHITNHNNEDVHPGSIALSNDLAFIAVGDAVLVVHAAEQRVIGKIEIANERNTLSLTSITLGEDGYLYLTTRTQLIRLRAKLGPVKNPTNLVPRSALRASIS
jgi:hypothetical protein